MAPAASPPPAGPAPAPVAVEATELPADSYAYDADDSVPAGLAAHLDGFDPRVHALDGERLVSPLDGGARAVLTLHPGLQAHIASRFASYEVPYGAVVAIEPSSGRVLAYVSHSSANPRASDLVLDPTPPTASVFKIITGAALLDAGVPRRHARLLPRRRQAAWSVAISSDEHRARPLVRDARRGHGRVHQQRLREAGRPPPEPRHHHALRVTRSPGGSACPSTSPCGPARRRCRPSASSSRARRRASGTRTCRHCTRGCWPPPSPTTGRCRAPPSCIEVLSARGERRVSARARHLPVGAHASTPPDAQRRHDAPHRHARDGAQRVLRRPGQPVPAGHRHRGQDRHAHGQRSVPRLHVVGGLRARGRPRPSPWPRWW
jgi:hypothetical protein